MERKNNGLVVFLITIVVVLVTFVVLYMTGIISFNKNNINENSKENNTQENNNVESTTVNPVELKENLDTNGELVVGLMKKISYVSDYTNNGDEYYGYYYKQDKYNSSDFSNKFILATSMANLLNEKYNSNLDYDITIEANLIEEYAKKIFGSDIKITHENIFSCRTSSWTYDANTNQYKNPIGGCGGAMLPYYESKIISAIKYNNERIEVVEKVAYVEFEDLGQGGLSGIVYTNDNKNNKITTLNPGQKLNIDNYLDQLDSYKYTFKEENGNYYLYSVEKIK